MVAIGRLEPFKGFDLLLKAAGQLLKEGEQFELAIIGDGPERRELEKTIRSQGLENNVFLKGWQGSDEVIKEIETSRALVMSSFAEGLPLVLIEAMMLGRPAIAPRIAGIPELIEDGSCGLLYPAGSFEDLKGKMKEMLRLTEDEITMMGKAGAERVSKQFNPDIEVRKLAELMKKHYLDHVAN